MVSKSTFAQVCMSMASSLQLDWNGCPRLNSRLRGLVPHVALCLSLHPHPRACLDSLSHPSVPAGIWGWPHGQDGVKRGQVETFEPASLFPSPASG